MTSALCRSCCAHGHRHSSGNTALPQGPSLRSGLCCPGPSSLIDPIRPTHRHIATSPQSGLYAMPSLCNSPRRPTSGSVLSLLVPSRHAALYDPGELTGDMRPIFSPATRPSPTEYRLGAPNLPIIRFRWVHYFGASWFADLLRPVELLASLTDPTGLLRPQRLLHPGFQRFGHPTRRRISLRWYLGISTGGTFTRWNVS
jgi:hypothetical protein